MAVYYHNRLLINFESHTDCTFVPCFIKQTSSNFTKLERSWIYFLRYFIFYENSNVLTYHLLICVNQFRIIDFILIYLFILLNLFIDFLKCFNQNISPIFNSFNIIWNQYIFSIEFYDFLESNYIHIWVKSLFATLKHWKNIIYWLRYLPSAI